jgi:parallel beta-helix repeat protein
MKKIVAVWLGLVMVFGFITIIIELASVVAAPTIWYVDDVLGSGGPDDPPEDYTSIQDAINASNDGDTVFVYNGTYNEEININKTLSLIGEDKSSTIIICSSTQSGTVIIENAMYVNVTGFTIISEVVPIGAKYALLLHSSYNCSVSNNIIHGYDYGGINLDHSSYNKLESNTINGSRWGTNVIVWLYSSHNKIKDNIIVDGMNSSISIGGYIYEEGCDENEVINNNITQGNNAIVVSSDNNVIKENDLTNNSNGIVVDGNNNLIYNNNIIDNTNQAEDTGINNLWNSSYPTGGNYWSDYSGLDECNGINQDQPGGDGIGDVPYIIDGDSQDNYPLMYPYAPIVNIDAKQTFSSIQEAIDDPNTQEGDTIFVRSGIYYENVVVNKTINLTGENRDTTIIDGSGIDDVVRIEADWVNITGYTITGSDSFKSGIELYCVENCSVFNNILSGNHHGVLLAVSNSNNIFKNKMTSNLWFGVVLSVSNNNNISYNDVSDNWHGISIYGSRSYSNNVSYNRAFGNEVGISIWNYMMPGPGTILESSGHIASYNIVFNNTYGIHIEIADAGIIEDVKILSSYVFNNDIGIYLSGHRIHNSIISNCSIKENRIGIGMISIEDETNISNNIIKYNKEYAILLNQSMNIKIYHNNFINNNGGGPQVHEDTYVNSWNATYPVGGNYWSDFIGADNFKGPYQNISGSDGIGDDAYVIDSDSRDYYPLMEPRPGTTLENYTVLQPGWNLISIPLIQKNQSLELVLESVEGYYDAVQWFDGSNSIDPWKDHLVGKLIGNTLSEINESMGIWIHNAWQTEVIFMYNGSKPTSNVTIPLHTGWNLVGYPSLTSKNRTTALNNIIFGSDVDKIQTYDARTQTWMELGPEDHFELCRGYWIHSLVDKTWEVPL